MWGMSRRCIKCLGLRQEGKNNPNWKGGRYYKEGYVMLYVGKGECVFEHIIVMEKHIGRKLLKGENVHHKNGVKDDNRIKNLELWVRPQPTGIRAKDMIDWAEEVLKTYRPIKEKL